MSRRALAAIALATTACGRGGAAPPRDAAGVRLPVTLDDRATDPLEVGAAPVDVWHLCDTLGAASIELVGPRGAYVHGDCAHRADYAFTLTQGAADLRRPGAATPISALAGIVSIEAETAAFAAQPPPPPLRIDIAGHAPITLTPDQLYATVDSDDGGERTRGVPLSGVLASAGAPAPTSVIVHASDGDYVVDPAWLHSPHDDLRIRYNRRGALRFRHERDGAPLADRRGVTSIEVH